MKKVLLVTANVVSNHVSKICEYLNSENLSSEVEIFVFDRMDFLREKIQFSRPELILLDGILSYSKDDHNSIMATVHIYDIATNFVCFDADLNIPGVEHIGSQYADRVKEVLNIAA